MYCMYRAYVRYPFVVPRKAPRMTLELRVDKFDLRRRSHITPHLLLAKLILTAVTVPERQSNTYDETNYSMV